MESKNGSTNKRGTSDSNSSPKRNVASSPLKKRKHGKPENGWFSTKSFFYGLIIAVVAWMFSQYWTDILPNINSNSGKSTSGSDQPKPSESHNEVKNIDLPVGFIPSCSIKGKESISAINRAKSDSCKQRIAELACRSVDASDGIGNLYPTHLPNFCPTARTHNPELAGQYLGCHQDSFEARLLTGSIAKNQENNSKHNCIQRCTKAGYSFAGLQFGNECFCGEKGINDLKKNRIDEEQCNKPCPGEPTENCGGYLTMNIYHTGSLPSKVVGFSGNSMLPESENIQKDNQVRIVFLLTINGRASRQVRRLIKQLYDGQNYFYIHVDSRQDYLYREMKDLESQFPENIYVTPNRWATIWGGASLLSMLTSCFKDLLQKRWEWDFVLNLSESDYPLKKREDLVAFLSNNRGKNFVKSHGREPSEFIRKQGLDKTFFECETHMWRLGTRKLPHGIDLDGGSDWIGLNKEFVSYVVNGDDELINGLRTLFSYTLLPAESFFHTTLRNSKFCSSYINNNLHLTNWKRHLGCKCQHKAVVDWCGCSPNDFTPEDWNKLKATGKKQLFFGRKFEPVICQSMLDEVDLWMSAGNKEEEMQHQTLDNWGHSSRTRYWQSIHHHLDTSPEPDQAIVEVANTLCTVAIDVFLKDLPQQYNFDMLHEITSYHNDNALEGVLLKFSVHGDVKINFEVFVHSTMDVIRKRIPFRQGEFQVGTNFDPKELVFRNQLNAINEHSKPVLSYSFADAESEDETKLVMKVAWVDPMGNIAYINEESITNSSVTKETIKPEFKTPMTNGIWTAMVINQQKNELLIKIPFLVFPSNENHVKSKPLSYKVNQEERQALTKMFQETNKNEQDNKLLKLNHDRPVKSEKKSVWQKQALNEFYRLVSICHADHANDEENYDNHAKRLNPDIPPCKETLWSSLSPDPKSAISKFDNDLLKLV